MRSNILLILLAISMLSAIMHCTPVDGKGGEITEITISTEQDSDRWFAFYGLINWSTTWSPRLNITSDIAANATDETRYLHLPKTYQYYLVSDKPNPFSSTDYVSPNLTLFDQRHNLSGVNSVSFLFENSSDFTLVNTYFDRPTYTLPTIYLNGQDADGDIDEDLFRQGLIQLEDAFLFVVPTGTKKGFDGRNYDFQMVLPYSIYTDNTYYIFGFIEPVDPRGSSEGNPTIQFDWQYDGTYLHVYTERYAAVTVRDELGKAYNANTKRDGIARLEIPFGMKYYIIVTKSGYRRNMELIYIPIPTKDYTNATGPDLLIIPPENISSNVTDGTADAHIICTDDSCFEWDSSVHGSLDEITDLVCSGSNCIFVGIDEDGFIKKYDLEPVTYTRPTIPRSNYSDVGSYLDGISHNLATRISSFNPLPGKEKEVFLFILSVFLILFLVVYNKRGKKRKHKVGYG